ncbi:hypothetical protein CDL15_Pgr006526 [Punica granatum]|uniref:Uncharacterized protein n=1 Tax=Punica granatum TaxID=22663 RepID=A0A218XYK4_PUNGR|nr:hypothetical protein CDL15_Pgr006526 [Punica granatum]
MRVQNPKAGPKPDAINAGAGARCGVEAQKWGRNPMRGRSSMHGRNPKAGPNPDVVNAGPEPDAGPKPDVVYAGMEPDAGPEPDVGPEPNAVNACSIRKCKRCKSKGQC